MHMDIGERGRAINVVIRSQNNMRNDKIIELYLKGKKQADIARMYRLKRQRIGQITKSIREQIKQEWIRDNLETTEDPLTLY